MRPSPAQAGGDRRRRIAILDHELDLLGIGRHRLGERRADVLADDIRDERES